MTIKCEQCRNQVVGRLATGKEIYPHRPDLHEKKFWTCKCGAWVGCHPGTENPLGTMAGPELRKLRSACHEAFDPLWLGYNATMKRKEAYSWLAKALGLSKRGAHISMLGVIQCERLLEILKADALPVNTPTGD